jgi:hypothetical protein
VTVSRVHTLYHHMRIIMRLIYAKHVYDSAFVFLLLNISRVGSPLLISISL